MAECFSLPFDRTYEGLKRSLRANLPGPLPTFDRTYEGLKRVPDQSEVCRDFSFDRTYEGLKLYGPPLWGVCYAELLTVPMRV